MHALATFQAAGLKTLTRRSSWLDLRMCPVFSPTGMGAGHETILHGSHSTSVTFLSTLYRRLDSWCAGPAGHETGTNGTSTPCPAKETREFGGLPCRLQFTRFGPTCKLGNETKIGMPVRSQALAQIKGLFHIGCKESSRLSLTAYHTWQALLPWLQPNP